MKDISTELKNNKILTTYILLLIATLIFLLIINFLHISYPLDITTRTASGELAIVGIGKVDVIPDSATVDLGISINDAKTINEAQTQINKVNNAIITDITALGVDKKDIKTSNYSINPNSDYSNGNNGLITGYNGNTTVTIKVNDISKFSQIIQAGTKAGANQVIGTNYNVEKPEVYQEQAREKAIQNAKEQAQKIAKELDIRLGNVTNFVENNSNPGPLPMMYEKSTMSLSAGETNTPSVNLQPGSQTITSTVTLYFDKK